MKERGKALNAANKEAAAEHASLATQVRLLFEFRIFFSNFSLFICSNVVERKRSLY